MLPSYDAAAVAQVMGIGFVRSAGDAATGDGTGGRPGTPEGAPRRRAVAEGDGWAIRLTRPDGRREGDAGAAVSPPSPVLIERAVETGLPRQALRHVAEWLAGGDASKVARFEWGVVPKTTLDRRTTRLSPEESERTERVARLAVHARRALGTEAEARAFLTTPHPRLDGRTPLDAAMTDLGTRRVEAVLNALEYGLAL